MCSRVVAPVSPVSIAGGTVRVVLRATPRAARNAIDGLKETADGTVRLAVRVTAPPEGGKANAAVVALLAKAWRLPKGAFAVVTGATGRDKTVAIQGDEEPAALKARLEEWMRGQP